jgi:hypothetical protein
MTRKQIYILIAVVLVLIGIGIIAYLTFGPSSAHLTVSPSGAFNDTGSGTSAAVTTTNQSTGSGTAGTVVGPNLLEITKNPVAAGVSVVDIAPATTTSTVSLASSTATTTVPQNSSGDIQIRYIDRESGNIYNYLANARTLTRISDKTLPGIQEASWLPDGSMALVQFLTDTAYTETIDTYALPANGGDGYFLAQDLDEAKIIGPTNIFTLSAGTDTAISMVLMQTQYLARHFLLSLFIHQVMVLLLPLKPLLNLMDMLLW